MRTTIFKLFKISKLWLLPVLFLSCIEKKTYEKVQNMNSPARIGASLPYLIKGDDGALYMSWVEQDSTEFTTFWYARMINGNWSDPSKIAEGNDWFVNWADYPAIAIDQQGNMIAHYLKKSGPDTYAYDVNVLIKPHGGKWSTPIVPHNDGTQTEHGFVTMLPEGVGQFRLVWLDGRKTVGSHNHHGAGGSMTLRTALIDLKGTITSEFELDERVCDCCQTGGAATKNGAVIVYRDRSMEEIRDISLIDISENGSTQPLTLGTDQWQIRGCPVNGPRVTSINNTRAVGWFTAAEEQPQVKTVFSVDAGSSWKEFIIDETEPMGRVDITLLDEGRAAVSWLDGGASTTIKCRFVNADGMMQEPIVISSTDAARASGFPQMEFVDGVLYFAWTNNDEAGGYSIKMARTYIR